MRECGAIVGKAIWPGGEGIWRGMGYRDGGEDCERFRRAAFDGQVKSAPSLLLRSAFADAVTLRDLTNNGVNVHVLSIGRGNAKTALSAGLALGAAMGKWDDQPRLEIIVAARSGRRSILSQEIAITAVIVLLKY